MDQEVAQYIALRNSEEPGDAQYIEHILLFLLASKYILYDAAKRKYLLNTIHALSSNPVYASMLPLFAQVNAKIEQIANDVRNHIPNDIETLGAGGFGCVVKPALPNRIDDEWKYYPDNVSKLYFDKKNAKKAVNNAKGLFHDLQNTGHKMARQNISYTASSFSPNIRGKCKLASDQVVTVTRMPFLGISIQNIELHYTSFRTYPIDHIFEQFLKLFHQVNTMQEKGYIHGDIRQGNIMANPQSGILTLIDFDWYLPKDTFFAKYASHLGFYSNPPESLLYENVRQGSHTTNEDTGKLEQYIRFQNEFTFRYCMDQMLTINAVRAANRENCSQFAKAGVQAYFDTMFPSFDSYGLGLTVLEFCCFVYPYRQDLKSRVTDNGRKYNRGEIGIIHTHIQRLYDEILVPMIHLRVQSRLPIGPAFAKMKRLCSDFQVAMRSLVSSNLENMASRSSMLSLHSLNKTRKARNTRVTFAPL